MAILHLVRDNLTLTVNLMAVFIYKVAIRGGQLGSKTNLSSRSARASRPASVLTSRSHQPPAGNNRQSIVSTGARSSGMVLSQIGEDEANGAGVDSNLLRDHHDGVEGVETIEAAQGIEIAELKRELRRVQMQAEYYRVKAMRKDNPHLSQPQTSGKDQQQQQPPLGLQDSTTPTSNKKKQSLSSTSSQPHQRRGTAETRGGSTTSHPSNPNAAGAGSGASSSVLYNSGVQPKRGPLRSSLKKQTPI